MREPIVLGSQQRGAGPVLLLIHGFPFDARMWASQLDALAGLRRVVAVDLRGRGLSRERTPPGPWTMDTHADDLARTLDELGEDQADLAGLSMGGYVAFAFARRHPARLRSLALLSTRAGADSPEVALGREQTAARARREGRNDWLVDGMLGRLLTPGASPAVRQLVRQMILDTPPETVAHDALALRDRPDSTHTLATLRVPTLVLHGDQDQLVPPAEAATMVTRISQSTYGLVRDAGHLPPLEQPAQTNRLLVDFYEDVSSPGGAFPSTLV